MSEDNVTPHPNPIRYWKVRRYTMFFCIFMAIVSTILFSVLSIYHPDALDSLDSVIGWFYGLLTFGVIGYYGNCAVEEYAKNRKK